jgi:nicotinamidase-related amidase
MILRANCIETLDLAEIATSGVVLSIVRHAADADYRLVVVGDCYENRTFTAQIEPACERPRR